MRMPANAHTGSAKNDEIQRCNAPEQLLRRRRKFGSPRKHETAAIQDYNRRRNPFR